MIIWVLGGLIYLIYSPIKNRLLKSGKLTTVLSKKIDNSDIVFICLVCILFYCFKDYRTSSRKRVEDISEIKLPNDFLVIKDEYQDMLQDYNIFYNIQFNNRGTRELINSI